MLARLLDKKDPESVSIIKILDITFEQMNRRGSILIVELMAESTEFVLYSKLSFREYISLYHDQQLFQEALSIVTPHFSKIDKKIYTTLFRYMTFTTVVDLYHNDKLDIILEIL